MDRNRQTTVHHLFLLGTGLVLLWIFEQLGGLVGINSFCYDLFFRLRGPRTLDERVVVVAVDEKSLKKIGRWPIARSHYARLLKITEQASVVGIDLIMAESSEDDQILAQAIARHGKVVLPVYFDHNLKISRASGALSSVASGHVHLEQDVDGIVRGLYHTIMNQAESAPSFTAVLYQMAVGKKHPGTRGSQDENSLLASGNLRQLNPMTINFYGSNEAVPHLSLIDILEKSWPIDFFKEKIVLVGVSAAGLEDRVLTPFSQYRDKMCGLKIQAQILSNLLDNNEIRTSTAPVQWLSAAILCFCSFLAFTTMRTRNSIPMSAGLILGILVTVFLLFSGKHIWFPPALSILSVVLSFFLAYFFHLESIGKSLRQAQTDWEQSFDAISDGIVICDRGGVFIKENIAARKMIDDRLRGRITKFRDRNSVKGLVSEEFFHDERKKYFLMNHHHRLDDTGQSFGSVLVIRDITDQKKAEETQRILEEQVFQAQKMESFGRLAGGVAHDFNNILTAILGFGEMTLNLLPDGHKGRGYLKEVLSAGNKGAGLVRQLLSFSRRERQEKKVVQLHLLINNMAKMLRRMIGENIQIDLRVVQVNNVEADPGQLEQIVMNLMVNARDAMPNGGKLVIETRNVEVDLNDSAAFGGILPGEYVMFSVSDSGSGIDEEYLPRIFDPFFSTKEEGKGTGLGLSIVWGIIRQHNGHITVDSKKGHGTRFKVLLPACSGQADAPEQLTEQILPKGRETLLLVEDQQEIRQLIIEILSPLGYAVQAASDSTSALKKMAEQNADFDLLLTDVVLPDLNGVQLAREIRKKQPDLKVLFMSGYPDETVAELGLLRPEVPFLSKPLTPVKLATAVRKALDGEYLKKTD